MSARSKGLVLAGLAALIGAAAFWLACGSRQTERGADSAGASVVARPGLETEHDADDAARAAASASSAGVALGLDDAGAASTATGRASASSGSARSATFHELWNEMAEARPGDVELLSRLERQTGRVPPVAERLVAMRKQGASFGELRDYFRANAPEDLRAKRLIAEWLEGLSVDAGPAPSGSDSGAIDAGAPSKPLPKLRGHMRSSRP